MWGCMGISWAVGLYGAGGSCMGLYGAVCVYGAVWVRVGLCARGAVWDWAIFMGQCGALCSRSSIGPEPYGAACTEQPAAIQGWVGAAQGRGHTEAERGHGGPYSTHGELYRVRAAAQPPTLPFSFPATPRREQAAERSGQRRGGEEGALPALPGPPRPPQAPPPRSRGGYVALSQVAEDGRLSPSSGSDGELESRGSSGYSSAEVNQELSRQLLRDGYHLDEVPDDEDLDLIPPKPAAAPCPWCFGDSLCCVLQ
nr:protein FAM219A isoform X2 [Anas platyrhynchos]